MIRLTIPYPPSVNGLYRNKGRGARGRAKTKQYKEWAKAAGWSINQQKSASIKGDYCLHVYAQRPDKRRRDLGNLLKPIEDLLVDMGIVDDDSFAASIHMEWNGSGKECCLVLGRAEQRRTT